MACLAFPTAAPDSPTSRPARSTPGVAGSLYLIQRTTNPAATDITPVPTIVPSKQLPIEEHDHHCHSKDGNGGEPPLVLGIKNITTPTSTGLST